MNVQNVADLLVSLFVVIVPIIGGFVTKHVLASKKVISLLQTAEPLAKTGVVLAEQAGVTNYLTSEAKKSKAVAYVLAELKKLGFTTADETTIASVVEKQFAESKQAIEAAYPQKTVADVEVDKKAMELKQAQADLAVAQAKVTSLTQAQ
ncbi:phage holin, LLH family [Limosilactobacillus fermentum]|uniref:phage holin, LLH family n=1 Tax=Limosilactobacillus fermentum TaxID=1613 RepID=UPI0034D57C33